MPALLFAPLHALGLHRLVAYNVVFLSGGVFSGVSMYYLARALTGRGMRRGLPRRSSPCIPIASSTSRISSCR